MPVTELNPVSLKQLTRKKYTVQAAFTLQILWTQAHSYMTLRYDNHTKAGEEGLIPPHSTYSAFWYL